MSELLDKFITLARKAHEGQKRKNGEPYFNHPMRVSERVDTDNRKMIATGHDLFEDTKVTPEDLLREGVPECVVRSIQVLTRHRGENYFDYVNRVIASKDYDAMAVKLADLEDNMSDLDEGSMKDKYRFTKDKIEGACFPIGGIVNRLAVDAGLYWIRRKPVQRPDGTYTEAGKPFVAEYTFVTDSNGNFTKFPIWWKMGGGLDDIDNYEIVKPVEK